VTRPILKILIVDDSPVDADMVCKALDAIDVAIKTVVHNSGLSAIEYLNTTEELPNLVLLDLHMPPPNGMEVLRQIRKDTKLQSIPVIMLSGTHTDDVIRDAYALNINAYVVKPGSYRAFMRVVKCIADFWLCTDIRLP